MKKYILVSDNYLLDLEDLVNNKLNDGYSLSGGVAILYEDGNPPLFIQPMVLEPS